MKKIAAAIILTAAAVMAAAAPQALAEDISVTINGRNIEFYAPPRIINDRVMVPMRKIFSELGAKIAWDERTKTATAVKDAQYVQFSEGSTYMLYGVCKNGLDSGAFEYAASDILDSEPVIEDGTMFVPLRAVSEAFYYNVDWEPNWNIVITTPSDPKGWIYYSSWTDGGHMYKIDTNGKNRTLLSKNDCFLDGGFRYINGYIYYSVRDQEREGCLYRIRTDGTGEECISDEPVYMLGDDFYGSSDLVYYIEGEPEYPYVYTPTGPLKVIDGKTGEIATLVEDDITDAELYDGYVYFRYGDAEDFERYFSCYRADKEGNIEQIVSGIPVSYFYINDTEEKLMISSETGKRYTANLDGSGLKEIKYESHYGSASDYGLDWLIYAGKDFVIGEKRSEDAIYGINADKTERFKLQAPAGASFSNAEYYGGRVYYSLRGGDYESQKMYVSDLEELMGIGSVSISSDMIDGQYVINTGDYRYIAAGIDGTYVMNDDGTHIRKIIGGYDFSLYDDEMILHKMGGYWGADYKTYKYDLTTGVIRKYTPDYYEGYEGYDDDANYDVVDINEYAKYGIIVYNSGRVEPYYQPSAWKYR